MSYLLTCFFLNRKCKKRQLKSKKIAGFQKDGLGMGPKKDSPYKYLAMVSQIGISMFVPIGLMFLVGRGLDYFFHTGPMVLVICIILGVITAFWNLYKIPMDMNEKALRYNKRRQMEYENEEKNQRKGS